MNRQKLATISCIVLSIVFVASLGLFLLFKVFLPGVTYTYEKLLYYPENLYKEYQEEAERMIVSHEYTSQYPARSTICSENGQSTLLIEVGEYDKHFKYSNYVTATVKNFGTDEQEVIFERSRKSAEEAYKSAGRYRVWMSILALVFVVVLIIFTEYLIKNSIRRLYVRVFYPISLIVACIVILAAMAHFFGT